MLGVSVDDVAAAAAFHQQQKLDFALLSDPDGSAARKYGVLAAGAPYARRVTFLIDRAGRVRHVDAQVDVRSHGADLVAVLRRLIAEEGGPDASAAGEDGEDGGDG